MIYRTDIEIINNYYESTSHINQSLLKEILHGMSNFRQKKELQLNPSSEIKKSYFLKGSAVDTFITMGTDFFNSQYHISTLENKPSELVMGIIKLAFDKYGETNEFWSVAGYPENIEQEEFKPYLMESIDFHNYYSNWKADTRYNDIVKKGSGYYNDLLQSVGKEVLSLSEYENVYKVANSITTHPHTKRIFKSAESEDCDIVYQFPITFTYDYVNCKGLLDMVYIDHANKKITPIDIKTMSDETINFPTSVRARRYDFQAAFYTEGLKYNLQQLSIICGKSLLDYKIGNFSFIVESTSNPGTPIVFKCTKELLAIGKYGLHQSTIYDTYNQQSHKVVPVEKQFHIWGFTKALELFKEGIKYDFKEPVVENNKGMLNLGWFGNLEWDNNRKRE